MFAAANNFIDVAQLQIDKGADIEAKNEVTAFVYLFLIGSQYKQ